MALRPAVFESRPDQGEWLKPVGTSFALYGNAYCGSVIGRIGLFPGRASREMGTGRAASVDAGPMMIEPLESEECERSLKGLKLRRPCLMGNFLI